MFDKLFKSKEAIAFEQALLEIRKAISLYNQDDVSKKQIDDAINVVRAQMSAVLNVIKNIPNRDDRMVILRRIAFVQSRLGNIEQAIEIAQEIKNKDHCSRALLDIAATQVDNLKGVIETLQKMPDKSFLSEILRDISVAQALSGNINHAIETAQSIPLNEDSRGILDGFTFAKSFIGNVQAKQAELQKVLEKAQRIGNETLRNDEMMKIVFTQAIFGDVEHAIDIAQKTLDPWYCSVVLDVLAKAFFWIGNIERAVEITRQIPDKSIRSMTLDAVTIHLMTCRLSIGHAIEIAQETPNEVARLLHLEEIISKQALLNDMNATINMLEVIGDEDLSTVVLDELAKVMAAFRVQQKTS